MKPNRSNKGFTLIETLTSVFLLLIFFAAVAVIFDIVTNIVGEARLRRIGTDLATQQIELVRNLTYDDIGTVGGIPGGILPQNETVVINSQEFVINTTVVYIDDPYDGLAPDDPIPTDYKRVTIQVSWGGVFASRVPVSISTDIVPDGMESNPGGGTLIISVINSMGEPVENAQVSITNDQVSPEIDLEISTNSQGRVLLPGAPACSDCYQVQVTRSGYSIDETLSVEDVANPLKPHLTVVESQVTSMTFTIDPTARLTVRTTGPRSSNFPPFSGVQFVLRGSKLIGYNDQDEPVYKYQETLATGTGGQLVLNGMEPDTYEVWIPAASSVDFAGSAPISPFALFPGIDRTLIIVTEPATTNNLLVIVQNTSDQPVSTASATISNLFGFEASGSAGVLGDPDNGQFLFSSLSSGEYQVNVSQIGYQVASTSAQVSGDSKVYVILETEE